MAARIMRAGDAPSYFPPLHNDVVARRLHGLEAGPTDAFWVGLSDYPPGSNVEEGPTAAECVYVLLSGSLELTADGHPHTLEAGDSVHFTKGTLRSVVNSSKVDAQLLVVIATPKDAA